jgi:DNA-directed RNA polymerase subunit E'/Rpb7
MSGELFIPIKFRTNIILQPNELTKTFEETILKKLKNNLENVCSKHGFIKKDSIKIIRRSIGNIKQQDFTVNIQYAIECIAEICNPAQGSIIKCKVKAKNLLGILAEGFYNNMPILEIIVPKMSAGIQSEVDIDKISIGDDIKIEVCGKKFKLFDKQISIIGKVIKNKEELIKTSIIDQGNDEEIIIEPDDDLLSIDIEEHSEIIEDDDERSSIKKIDVEEDEDDDEDEEEDEDFELDGGDFDDIEDEINENDYDEDD